MGGVLGKPNPNIRRVKVVAFLSIGYAQTALND